MVLFGNVTINHDTFNVAHLNITASDHAMNYGCGSVFVILVVLGLTLCPFLYYYFWKKRVTWTARFYRFLAFISCMATVAGSLPMAIYLMMPGHLKYTTGFISYLNQFLCLLTDFSWDSQLAVIFMLCAMQWIYIHKPLWSLVYNAKFKRTGLFLILCVVFICCGAFGFMLFDKSARYFGWLEQVQIAFAQNGTGDLLKIILIIIPQLLLVVLSVTFFLATCIMLHRSEIDVNDTMKCDLITIGLMVCGDVVWVILKIANMQVISQGDNTSYSQLYLWFITNNLAPAVLAIYNSVVIAACDRKIRVALLVFVKTGKLDACDHEQLDG